MFIKTTVFSQTLFSRTHVFYVSPLQVLVVASSYRLGLLANFSVGGYHCGYDPYPHYYTLCSDIACEMSPFPLTVHCYLKHY